MYESRGKQKQAGNRAASLIEMPVLSTKGATDQAVKCKLQSLEPSKKSETKANGETGEVIYMCRENLNREFGREI